MSLGPFVGYSPSRRTQMFQTALEVGQEIIFVGGEAPDKVLEPFPSSDGRYTAVGMLIITGLP